MMDASDRVWLSITKKRISAVCTDEARSICTTCDLVRHKTKPLIQKYAKTGRVKYASRADTDRCFPPLTSQL